MDDVIFKYIINDSENRKYSAEEIQKAVDMIKKFIERLESFRIEENGTERKLNQIEEFSLIYDYVANRKYFEDENAHSIVGVLNNGYSVCEGFTKLAQILCELRGIPFLYKNVTTGMGKNEHGNFQVIVCDSEGTKHCLHCDPTIDCLNDKDVLTYNAFLITASEINNYYAQQMPSAGNASTCLFWKLAVEGKSVEEIREELENISDDRMIIPTMMGKSKQDVINDSYEEIKNGMYEVGKFLGVDIPYIDTNEKVLEVYQKLLEKYKELSTPLNKNQLFEIIKKVYRQNSISQDVDLILEQRINETKTNERRYWNKETNIKRDKLHRIVYEYVGLAGISDTKVLDDFIERLTFLDINDSIDQILVSLSNLLDKKALTVDEILSNANLILSLNPDKYRSTDDLIARLNLIKSMNMEYPRMSLTENHKLVIEAFDKLNSIIGVNFDSFYTGGLMGYLATNHPLKRYHGDLDLFINENQLLELYRLIQQSEDFEFESNMDHKEENGHEFKLVYRGTPMSVGLFLFDRLPNQEMVLKEYYYPAQDKRNGLHVNERHLTGEYASMVFSNQIMKHNGIPYKTQSLEGIYHAKRNSRPKDRYDAKVIESFVDVNIVNKLDSNRDRNYNVDGIMVVDSIVEKLDEMIAQGKQVSDINIDSHSSSHQR